MSEGVKLLKHPDHLNAWSIRYCAGNNHHPSSSPLSRRPLTLPVVTNSYTCILTQHPPYPYPCPYLYCGILAAHVTVCQLAGVLEGEEYRHLCVQSALAAHRYNR